MFFCLAVHTCFVAVYIVFLFLSVAILAQAILAQAILAQVRSHFGLSDNLATNPLFSLPSLAWVTPGGVGQWAARNGDAR